MPSMPVTRTVYQTTRRALEQAKEKVERDQRKVEALEMALKEMVIIPPASKEKKSYSEAD